MKPEHLASAERDLYRFVTAELLAEAEQRSPLDQGDLKLLLTAPGYHTDYRNALIWRCDLEIDGDLEIGDLSHYRAQEWLETNEVEAIVIFGDCTITGNLVNDESDYWPLFFVAGDLKLENCLHGGLPIVVLGDLLIDGFLIGHYNDGLLRVGGDLVASGYIPCVEDDPKIRGHVIHGEIRARHFETAGAGRQEYSTSFVAAALDQGYLDPDRAFALHKRGEAIFREEGDTSGVLTVPEPPPACQVDGVDPLPLGRVLDVAAARTMMLEQIDDRAPVDPDRPWIRQSLAGRVKPQLDYYPAGNVLVLPHETVIGGDFELDWDSTWCRGSDIVAVYAEGDVAIAGDLLNSNLDGGPILLVSGNLTATNVVKSGAPLVVLGDLIARGVVVGEYNHGSISVGRNLSASAYLLFDHSSEVFGEIEGPVFDEDDGVEWREVLVPEVFESLDDDVPEVELIWRNQRAGRELLLGEATKQGS